VDTSPERPGLGSRQTVLQELTVESPVIVRDPLVLRNVVLHTAPLLPEHTWIQHSVLSKVSESEGLVLQLLGGTLHIEDSVLAGELRVGVADDLAPTLRTSWVQASRTLIWGQGLDTPEDSFGRCVYVSHGVFIAEGL